jgi:hypothetical protein
MSDMTNQPTTAPAAGEPFPVIRLKPLGGKRTEVIQITPAGLTVKEVRGGLTEEDLAPPFTTHIPLDSIRRVTRARVGYPSESSFRTHYLVEAAPHGYAFGVPERDAANVDRVLGPLVREQLHLEAPPAPSATERRLIIAGLVAFWVAFALVARVGGRQLLTNASAVALLGLGCLATGLVVAISTGWRAWAARRRRRAEAATDRPKPRRGRAGRKPFRSPLLGWPVKVAGIAWILLVARSGWVTELIDALARNKNLQLVQYVLFTLYVPGYGLLYVGYRLCLRTFEPRRHADPRPPVVYLRGFDDDGRGTFQPATLLARMHGIEAWGVRDRPGWSTGLKIPFWFVHPVKLLRMFLNADRQLAEEVLAAAFRRCGPLVAVGRPGEWLATPGARRVYVPDEDWQRVVLDCLEGCQAVVLQPSMSEGVRWEMEQVFGRVERHRILLSLANFRDRPNDYEDFRAWLEGRCGARLPLAVPFLGEPCFVYFETDGTPRLQRICLTSPLLWSFTCNAVDTRETFRTFIHGLNGEPRDLPREPRKARLAAALSVLVPLAYFLALAFLL